MYRFLFMSATSLALVTSATAQTGEDHSAKSDVTNRAGSNGSTGATSRNPSDGADPNMVAAGSSLGSTASAPKPGQGHITTPKRARAHVKKVQAQQRGSGSSAHEPKGNGK